MLHSSCFLIGRSQLRYKVYMLVHFKLRPFLSMPILNLLSLSSHTVIMVNIVLNIVCLGILPQIFVTQASNLTMVLRPVLVVVLEHTKISAVMRLVLPVAWMKRQWMWCLTVLQTAEVKSCGIKLSLCTLNCLIKLTFPQECFSDSTGWGARVESIHTVIYDKISVASLLSIWGATEHWKRVRTVSSWIIQE